MGLVTIGLGVLIAHSLFKPVDVEHISGPILAILYVPTFGAIGGLLLTYAASLTVLSGTHPVIKMLGYPLGGLIGVLPQVYYMIIFADRRYVNELSAHADWLLVGVVLGLVPALYVGYRFERS